MYVYVCEFCQNLHINNQQMQTQEVGTADHLTVLLCVWGGVFSGPKILIISYPNPTCINKKKKDKPDLRQTEEIRPESDPTRPHLFSNPTGPECKWHWRVHSLQPCIGPEKFWGPAHWFGHCSITYNWFGRCSITFNWFGRCSITFIQFLRWRASVHKKKKSLALTRSVMK